VQRNALGFARGFTSQLGFLPSGIEGTRQTLDLMVRITNDAKTRLEVRNRALSLTRWLPPKAWRAQVDQLFKFVRDQIRYTRDIRGVETLTHPVQTLAIGQGDCDDKSMLLAALLESIGHPTRFIAVGLQPNSFQHVLVETVIGDDWVALETTKGDVPMGWFPAGVKARMYANN
jgi:transglutaminase-like putative cysteine protease